MVKIFDRLRYKMDLSLFQFCIHGKREDLAGNFFSHRQVAWFITQELDCFLQMIWNWIMDAGKYPKVLQVGLKLIPTGRFDHIQMVNRYIASCDNRHSDRCAG